MCNEDRAVVRVLLLNIEQGDRRKFEARSNDVGTGGGARDLRFRPSAEFFPFFGRMFPGREFRFRGSIGTGTKIEVLCGEVRWHESGVERSGMVKVWPPTNARPNECRIARISSFDLHGHIVDDPNGRRSVFMMFQQADGTVRLYFTTETSLRDDNWDSRIKTFAAGWFRVGSKTAFLDLETREQIPHG